MAWGVNPRNLDCFAFILVLSTPGVTARRPHPSMSTKPHPTGSSAIELPIVMRSIV